MHIEDYDLTDSAGEKFHTENVGGEFDLAIGNTTTTINIFYDAIN